MENCGVPPSAISHSAAYRHTATAADCGKGPPSPFLTARRLPANTAAAQAAQTIDGAALSGSSPLCSISDDTVSSASNVSIASSSPCHIAAPSSFLTDIKIPPPNAFSQHIRGRYFSMQGTYWASVLSDSDLVSVSADFSSTCSTSSTFSSAAFLSFLAGRCWAAAC